MSHNCHAQMEPTSQETTKVCSRVGQLVFLISPSFKVDKDTLVEVSWNDLNRGSSELRAQLVEASSGDPLFRAIYVKGRYRWMM